MGKQRLTLVEENITKDQILANSFNRTEKERSWRSQPTTCGTTQVLEGFQSSLEEVKVAARARQLEEDIREPTQDLEGASIEALKEDRARWPRDSQKEVSEQIDLILLNLWSPLI